MTKKLNHKYDFRVVYSDKYATLTYNEELALAICTADSEYIPINDFKTIFLAISELTETLKVNYFIFDKSKLRTFHQPSMEWYFAIWKPSLKPKGLVNHYKILPDLEWFAKAVEAGKQEIYQKYGKDILNGININYISSTKELIDQLEKVQ
jgi:hypothetical protein